MYNMIWVKCFWKVKWSKLLLFSPFIKDGALIKKYFYVVFDYAGKADLFQGLLESKK